MLAILYNSFQKEEEEENLCSSSSPLLLLFSTSLFRHTDTHTIPCGIVRNMPAGERERERKSQEDLSCRNSSSSSFLWLAGGSSRSSSPPSLFFYPVSPPLSLVGSLSEKSTLLVELPRSFSPLNPATLGWDLRHIRHTHTRVKGKIYIYSRNLNM